MNHGVELASPKAVIRACAQNGLLDEDAAQAAMQMIDDRNLTAHTYNEALAVAIYGRMPSHAGVLRKWLDQLQRATNPGQAR